MENPKIIICDCDHADIEQERGVFEAAGVEYKRLHCLSQDEVIEKCQGAECFLNQYVLMDEKIFKNIPTLKMIVRYGVGVDNVRLEDATRYGVQVCNVPDYGTEEVASQALALMLNITRKTHMIANLTSEGVWKYQEAAPVHRLSTRTVGVIGMGRIGAAFAKMVQPLGCKIIAFDSFYGHPGFNAPDFIEFKQTADEVLKEADIISLHCGLDKSNEKMMNAEAFAKMKDGSFLINVSRGGLIDEDALDAALSSGKLAGAGLDVVTVEPLPKESPLFRHKNVLVTPHIGWYSVESALELKRKCAEEAVRYVRGESPRYPVNRLK